MCCILYFYDFYKIECRIKDPLVYRIFIGIFFITQPRRRSNGQVIQNRVQNSYIIVYWHIMHLYVMWWYMLYCIIMHAIFCIKYLFVQKMNIYKRISIFFFFCTWTIEDSSRISITIIKRKTFQRNNFYSWYLT